MSAGDPGIASMASIMHLHATPCLLAVRIIMANDGHLLVPSANTSGAPDR